MFNTQNYQGESFTQEESDLCNSAVIILVDDFGLSDAEASDLVSNRFFDGVTLQELVRGFE